MNSPNIHIVLQITITVLYFLLWHINFLSKEHPLYLKCNWRKCQHGREKVPTHKHCTAESSYPIWERKKTLLVLLIRYDTLKLSLFIELTVTSAIPFVFKHYSIILLNTCHITIVVVQACGNWLKIHLFSVHVCQCVGSWFDRPEHFSYIREQIKDGLVHIQCITHISSY